MFSAAEQASLHSYLYQAKERKFNDREAIIGMVQGVSRTVDHVLNCHKPSPGGSFFRQLALMTYSLQGVPNTSTHYHNERRKIIENSSLAPLEKDLMFDTSHVTFSTGFPYTSQNSDHGVLHVSVGKNLVLRDVTLGPNNKKQITELTIPGQGYVFSTDELTIEDTTIQRNGAVSQVIFKTCATPAAECTTQVMSKPPFGLYVTHPAAIEPLGKDTLDRTKAYIRYFSDLLYSAGSQNH